MSIDYKKLFVIHKHLLKNHIPDDLMLLFFEYIGDLNESVSDLVTKHCFYIVRYKYPYLIAPKEHYMVERVFGHYCNLCKKLYIMQSPAQIRHHIRSNIHRFNLKHWDKIPAGRPTQLQMVLAFKNKHYNWYTWSQRVKKMVVPTINHHKIVFNQLYR